MTVTEYLHKKAFQYKRRGDEAQINCPFCDPPDRERKFSVNLLTGAFNCLHLNRCGVKGSFIELQKKFGDDPIPLNGKRFYNDTIKKSYTLPKGSTIKPPTDKVREYLKGRGFTDDTIEYFRFGTHNDDTVMIPYYRNGNLISVKYRSITDKKKMWIEKNTEPILLNRDKIEKDSLIICEGEFDCAALHQYGIESVSVPMGAANFQWVETEWEYIETFQSIYICFDNDQAGKIAARELALKLGEWRCFLVTLPRKDANACLMEGISSEDIIKCFTNPTDMKPETLVSPLYFKDKVQSLFIKGTQLFGTKTPWESLNAILKGWRNGELTVWSGRNGSGKSTILNQVFIDLASKGIKSCIYSGEMSPERYLRWAIIQHQKNENPHPDKIDQTILWMSSWIYILNITSGIEPEKLVSDFEYAAKRYGVKHFIIDSLMKISFKGQDEYKQQHDFTARLSSFAQKHSVHVHLVAHPRKTEKDDDEPGKVDIKGSSHITDLADNVIVLYRLSEEKKDKVKKKAQTPADMRLYVKKNREFGVEGAVNMAFDEQTKRFSD